MEGYKMTLPEPLTKEWFLLNAVCMWLKEFPDHEWAPNYADLLSKLEQLKNAQPTTPKVQTRGRPAKRQRKKEAASNTSSKSKDASTN